MQLIAGQYTAPLSNAIQKEYNKLATLIGSLPKEARTKKMIDFTGDKASVSDVIAYQIGWGTLLLSWYEAGKQGLVPSMPGEGFEKWDYVAIAQAFYERYHYDGSEKQEQVFHDTVSAILAFVEKEYQSTLDTIGVWSWCTLPSGKQWPLSKWVTVNTVAPYKRAAGLIKNTTKK